MKADPQAEHRWLEQLLGDWVVTSEMSMPDHEPWIESVRSMGGLWVVAAGAGPMPGGARGETLVTFGYDPRTGRYVGSWIGSMMAHHWVYDGAVEPDGKSLVLDCEGPDFEVDGKLARYQDVITIVDADTRTLTARVQTQDGAWKPFMTAHYQRRR